MRLFALAFVLVSFVLAGSVGARAAPDSGIVGVVRLAPQCLPAARSCSRQLPTVTIRVLQPRTGKLVATARPGRQGRFRIVLPSGRYVLEGISASGDALFGPRLVRVRPHALTLVLLTSSDRLRSDWSAPASRSTPR